MSTVETQDAVSILHYFKDLPDPRCHINRLHLLGDLIVISVMAVIAGADGRKPLVSGLSRTPTGSSIT